jgi:hypothetical protein
MDIEGEQLKKESFELAALTPEQHAITTVPKFTTDLPFFYLTNKKKLLKQDIHYEGVDPSGKPIRWEVTPNRSPKIGVPGIEAHTIWNRLLKPVMDVYLSSTGEIPEILPLGGIRECLRIVGWKEGGWEARGLLQGLMQIGQSTCDADFFLPTRQNDSVGKPLFKPVKAIFNRFTIWKIGSTHISEEELATGNFKFDFDLNDTLYLQLHKLERDIQSSQDRRYLDNQYMFSVGAAARRWYELMAGKIFGVVKNKGKHCEILYSWYVKHHHTLERQTTHKRIVEQMNRIVSDHLVSGFISHVEYQRIKEPGKEIDFLIRYHPGKEAKESIGRVLAALNRKQILPTGERWARFPKEKKEDTPIPFQNELMTDEPREEEVLAQVYLLPAPERDVPTELLRALTDRGVMGAFSILKSLPPDGLEKAPDVIDYWDSIRGDKGPGLLVNLLKSSEPLPASFETRKQRREREEAAKAREYEERIETIKELLYFSYKEYVKGMIDRYIKESLPEGEYQKRLAVVSQRLQEQNGRTPWNHSPETIEHFAVRELREELAQEITMLSFDQYCLSEAPLIRAKYGVDPVDLGIPYSDISKDDGMVN